MSDEEETERLWLLSADRGGTFTDCRGVGPDGSVHRVKVLSSGVVRLSALRGNGAAEILLPEGWDAAAFSGWEIAWRGGGGEKGRVAAGQGRVLTLESALPAGLTQDEAAMTVELFTGEPAPVVGARLLTGTRLGADFPPLEYRLGTTLATNALLEGKHAAVALFITKGFGDLTAIGDQRRPDLFARVPRREAPLHAAVAEVEARMDAAGQVLQGVDEAALRAVARELVSQGLRTAAVALLHSWANPAHEHEVARILREEGFTSVSLSAELSPLIRLLPRAVTAVVDAALAPVISDFVRSVREPLGNAARRLLLLTSAGGLEPPEAFRACRSLLSGPAGGVAGCAAVARACGVPRVLTLDMGGTSTDVARWEGARLYQFEQKVGQATILAPSLRIGTVAAGGGSICDVTAEGLTVGPQSAGAFPGPACYGAGGPLTLTDVNLLLGRLDPDRAGIPLFPDAARQKLAELRVKLAAHGLASEESDESLLRGLLDIAVERMAEAVRSISVREGCDPQDYALLAFGGAGPQHACAIATRLGMREVIVPRDAGLLSALGAACTGIERMTERQVLQPLDAVLPALPGVIADISRTAAARLAEAGVSDAPELRCMAELRLKGQDTALTLDFIDPAELSGKFREDHLRLYGYEPPAQRPVELVSLRVLAAAPERSLPAEHFPDISGTPGPQIIQDAFSTLIVEPGWAAVQGSEGTWRLKPCGDAASASPRADAAESELFRCRIQGMVDAMGELLRRTAVSTNVKERLDFSCALLDAQGRLVCNAPHIPVHLGALGECVRRSVAAVPCGPGDVLVTNDPAYGGSHLPDVTVICPVHDADGVLIGYTANRAHHAEIGGITPGSMPAFARSLAEEGVVIPPRHAVRGGAGCEEEIAALLTGAPFPTRNLRDNLSDLRAQIAAARAGADTLASLCATRGREELRRRMEALTTQARDAFSRMLSRSALHTAEARETLDDGTPVCVRLECQDGRLRIDFTGTGGVHPGSRNAGTAIVRSAVLYVLRLWVCEAIPLNEGVFDLIDLHIPRGLLNPPFDPAEPSRSPAVVAGNVETSQRVVDTLLKALQLTACSQGTMNNVIFGDGTFGHYETLCGGAGAGPEGPGGSAVHTHMTNTAITDPEILEHRFPVRLREFSIRRGSGGAGLHAGGDGAVRVYEFLRPLTLSILTEHRQSGPFGMHGGAAASPGRQTLMRADGSREILPSSVSLPVNAGDVLRMETPGGGGWGDSCP